MSSRPITNDFYRLLVRLATLFANMVDHGMEMPEERTSIGKDTFGTISCHIDESDGRVMIAIAYDGSVIDTADIRRIASAEGWRPPWISMRPAAMSSFDIFSTCHSRRKGLSAMYPAAASV